MSTVVAFPQVGTDSPTRPHALGEALFRSVLVRERKGADRSNGPFLLFLVSSPDASRWPAVIEALTAAKRETDMLGWFAHQQVLGVIYPDFAYLDTRRARSIERRVRQELAKRIPAGALASISIEPHAHPGLPTEGHEEFKPVDPLLARIRPTHQPAATVGLKRALDVVGSVALLILCSPLLATIAALVKVSSKGPVFFRQERVGEGEKPFTMLKFRTMYTGVDQGSHQEFVTRFIKSSGAVNEPVKDAPFKIANDPRVTPLGRFLRKTSLDELPQFWNVVRGEMALVGPRPPLAYEVQQYQPWHTRRILEAKPGITGLWQVKGRSRTTFDDMVRLDIRYARTCSIWTDIKILLATPAAVITGKGAC
jgi:lipopolysaccharide/colanic/teichoic acid biosynthesis glycosyltransferase